VIANDPDEREAFRRGSATHHRPSMIADLQSPI